MAARRKKRATGKTAREPKERRKKRVGSRAVPAKKAAKKVATRVKRPAKKTAKKGATRVKRPAKKAAKKVATRVKRPAKKAAKKAATKKVARRASKASPPAKRPAQRGRSKAQRPKPAQRPAATSTRRPARGAKKPAKGAGKKRGRGAATTPRSPVSSPTKGRTLRDVKQEVIRQLVSLHGIDPVIAPKATVAFDDLIRARRKAGDNDADIAIRLADELATEGQTFKATRASKPTPGTFVDTTELLQAQLLAMREKTVKSRILKGYSPPSADLWGTLNEHGELSGYRCYVPIQRMLTMDTVDDIVSEVLDCANRVWVQHGPEALLWSTIELYEYGAELVGSKKFMLYRQGVNNFGPSIQATKGVSGYQFERTFRTKLRKLALVENAAVFVESVTIKSFDKPPAK